MEHLPVEVVGNILSRLAAARDVVIASATCRKWREAFRKHLHSISFNPADWPDYHEFTTCRLEILITQTILQTSGLESLTILMEEADEFSASTVIAWLMYTRESLRKLHCNVRVMPTINILEICGRQRLETLSLSNNNITGVDPSYQRFPCLTSLSLSHVSISSALDLNLLLTACPKIKILNLVNLDIAVSDAMVNVELCSSTLKSFFIEGISLDKFALEADSLESLHLKDSALEVFEFLGKGSLKEFRIDDVSIIHLEIGESFENLEIVDINNFTIIWPKFYQMISKSSKLGTLRLWDVMFDDEDEIVELEAIAICFPRLTRLSLSYDLKDGMLHYAPGGSYSLNNVVFLEVGSSVMNDGFSYWIERLLQHCPDLRKLIIHGTVSDMKSHEDCQLLASFTCSMVRLMRKHMNVEVQFDYE